MASVADSILGAFAPTMQHYFFETMSYTHGGVTSNISAQLIQSNSNSGQAEYGRDRIEYLGELTVRASVITQLDLTDTVSYGGKTWQFYSEVSRNGAFAVFGVVSFEQIARDGNAGQVNRFKG
jgi:hypothetical protein